MEAISNALFKFIYLFILISFALSSFFYSVQLSITAIQYGHLIISSFKNAQFCIPFHSPSTHTHDQLFSLTYPPILKRDLW